MKPKIFFLKHQPQSLKAVEEGLRADGYKVSSSNELRESLYIILQDIPEFIFIPADFPTPKVKTLPQILAKTLPVTIIGYIETTTNENMSALHKLGLEYTLIPPFNAQTIQRLIQKISEDKKDRSYYGLQTLTTLKKGPEKTSSYLSQEIWLKMMQSEKQPLESLQLGLVQAVSAIIDPGDGTSLEPLHSTKQLSIFKIQCGDQQGYVSCAWGTNQNLPADFSEKIRASLNHFFKNQNVGFSSENVFHLEIIPVDFKSLSEKTARFMQDAIHLNKELGVAFFLKPKDFSFYHPDPAVPGMLYINISDIEQDSLFTFDLYLYMPENQKFILYTPKGLPLYKHQMERLNERGISKMHFYEQDRQEADKSEAKYFLESLAKKIEAKD